MNENDKNEVLTMTNEELLDYTIFLAGGDENDISMTSDYKIHFIFCENLLYKHLKEIGFLN